MSLIPSFQNHIQKQLEKTFEEFRMFDELLNPYPRFNIKENENNFEIEIEALGLKKDEIKVEIEDNILTISTHKKIEKEDTNSTFIKRELFFETNFTKSFKLSENVDVEKIESKLEDGVLKIFIPKLENKSPNKRLIEIK